MKSMSECILSMLNQGEQNLRLNKEKLNWHVVMELFLYVSGFNISSMIYTASFQIHFRDAPLKVALYNAIMSWNRDERTCSYKHLGGSENWACYDYQKSTEDTLFTKAIRNGTCIVGQAHGECPLYVRFDGEQYLHRIGSIEWSDDMMWFLNSRNSVLTLNH